MKKILVLDDSPFMLTVIENIIRGLGYDVTTTQKATEACRLVQASQFDMIITDLNMPEMDGLEFTQLVRTYPGCRFIPILMLSGEGNDEKVAKAKKFGVSTFLSKPVDESRFKSLLQIILSKRKSPRVELRVEIYQDDNNILSGYSVNFSSGGLFLETRNTFAVGEELEVRFFETEESAPICCNARVAWVNSPLAPIAGDHPPGVGLEFISGVNELKIRDFIQRKIKTC